MTLKHCNGCDEDKELSEFNFNKSGKRIGKPLSQCKNCLNLKSSIWYKVNIKKAKATRSAWQKSNPDKIKLANDTWHNANREKVRKSGRESSYRHGAKPASENKSCATYLGCVIAETVLSHEFPGFKRMPNGNPGYDYVCPKGYKIDVKSGCKQCYNYVTDSWYFSINKNKAPSFFLCIAWDNRESLNPAHLWLIPGWLVNEKTGFRITDSPKVLARWSQYERPLENVLECCSKLRVN